MTLILSEPPIIDIEVTRASDYIATLTMNGVKEICFASTNYRGAVCFADGLAAGVRILTGRLPIVAHPATLEQFIARLSTQAILPGPVPVVGAGLAPAQVVPAQLAPAQPATAEAQPA